jgi:hypothetical protein
MVDMKKATCLLIAICLVNLLSGQIRNINFSGFAPTAIDQYKGTCYAYATTYTALSVQRGIIMKYKSYKEINDNAFSETFTASRLNSKKSFFKKIITFWSCSSGGNIEKAADILKDDGAIPAADYPNCCSVAKEKEKLLAANYKIAGWDSLYTTGETTSADETIKRIKALLIQQRPVICAIHITPFLSGYKDFDFIPVSGVDDVVNNKNSNHAICILGFDDDRKTGSFLLKNNYQAFGNDGFIWMKYADFLKYFTYAISLKDFVNNPPPAAVASN